MASSKSTVKKKTNRPAKETIEQIDAEHEQRIKKLISYLWGPNCGGSHSRLMDMIDLLFHEDPDVFFGVFNEVWNSCDNTWRYHDHVLILLESNNVKSHFSNHLDADGEKFFAALPQTITVYRGCSREEKRGISWTTSEKVAASFAVGHRGIPVPHAAVFRATIFKADLLTVIVNRKESEVLVDPCKLQLIKEVYGWGRYANGGTSP